MEIVQQAISAETIGAKRDAAGDDVARSVLRALAYSDLFDYPLSLQELVRYQIETAYSAEEIYHILSSHPSIASAVSRSDSSYYCLRGREAVFAVRQAREQDSGHVWKRARLYSRIMSRLPFVRMVSVTGALAVNNIAARPDIDLLIVTANGRVWISRRLIVILVRLARLFRDDLCPNYIISEDSLSLDQRDLFTAHELAQMVPLYGGGMYRQMILDNSWAEAFLPAAFPETELNVPSRRPGVLRRGVEWILRRSLFDRWERAELSRLRAKLRPVVGQDAEVVCSPHQCKGHTGLHRQWVTTRYEERLVELGF